MGRVIIEPIAEGDDLDAGTLNATMLSWHGNSQTVGELNIAEEGLDRRNFSPQTCLVEALVAKETHDRAYPLTDPLDWHQLWNPLPASGDTSTPSSSAAPFSIGPMTIDNDFGQQSPSTGSGEFNEVILRASCTYRIYTEIAGMTLPTSVSNKVDTSASWTSTSTSDNGGRHGGPILAFRIAWRQGGNIGEWTGLRNTLRVHKMTDFWTQHSPFAVEDPAVAGGAYEESVPMKGSCTIVHRLQPVSDLNIIKNHSGEAENIYFSLQAATAGHNYATTVRTTVSNQFLSAHKYRR